MKSHFMAVAIASAMIGAPVFTATASAQSGHGGTSGGYLVPVVIGAAAGATVGALLWPAMVPAGAAAMAVPAMSPWGMSAFFTTRAAIGAAIGGGLGYAVAR